MHDDPLLAPSSPQLRAPTTILLDARGGADGKTRFAAGHLRGARFVDLETDLSEVGPDAAEGGRHPLPAPAAFAAALGRLGVEPSSDVVVYDDLGGANAAARAWWMLRALGHERVRVLDGGLAAAIEAGLPVIEGEGEPWTATDYPISADASWALPRTDLSSALEHGASDDALLIDVRHAERYGGEREPIDPIAGHIPGATHHPLSRHLGDDGRFLSAEDLRAQYDALLDGRDPSRVIVSCGSGVTACHALLAMERAGLSGASLYVGSFSEFCRRDDAPPVVRHPSRFAPALDVAEALFAAVSAGQVARVGALYYDDATVKMNTSPRPLAKKQMLGVIRFLANKVQDLRYEDVHTYEIEGGFVRQHTLRCVAPNGEEVSAAACVVARVERGRIRHLDEYLDSAAVAAMS